MSPESRFKYMKKPAATGVDGPPVPIVQTEPAPEQDVMTPPAAVASSQNSLQRVARGQGRYPSGMTPEERRATTAQLNVRLAPMLKRQISARAALEGVPVGDLIERLLIDYLEATKTES